MPPSGKPDPEAVEGRLPEGDRAGPAGRRADGARSQGAARQKDRQAASAPAEEARKILEEIQKAQPRNEQPEQKNQEQKKQIRRKRKSKQKQETKGPARKTSRKTRAKDEQEGQQEKKEQKPGDSDCAKEGSSRTASLARPGRVGTPQGPGTAAGEARARPHGEGPRVGKGTRGEGLVMRRAHTFDDRRSAVVVLLLLAAPARAAEEPEIAVEAERRRGLHRRERRLRGRSCAT